MMFHFFTKPCGKGLYTYYVIMGKGVKAHLMTVIIPSVGGGKHQNDYVLHKHFCIINLKSKNSSFNERHGVYDTYYQCQMS